MDADTEYANYMREVSQYVEHIKHHDRRVFHTPEHWRPRFSEAREQGFFKNPPPTGRLEHACLSESWWHRVCRWWTGVRPR